ncbi:MAG: hypothetical protein AAFW75_01745, partial [Cyanobacteria bacterium J06636_16]
MTRSLWITSRFMNSRLQLTCQPQKSLRQLAFRGLFAVTLGLVTVACSKGVTSSPQSDPPAVATEPQNIPTADTEAAVTITTSTVNPQQAAPESTSTLYAEVGNDGEPNEPLTANIERLDLQAGTPYGEVRSLIMAEGWMPYTQAEGAVPDLNDRTVQELHAQGFEEAE